LDRIADIPIDVVIGNVHGWPGLQQERSERMACTVQ
jgi:hypothetical protein